MSAILTPGPSPYRFTVAQYEQMASSGIFGDKAPFELIRGLIVMKKEKTPPLCVAQSLLDHALRPWLPSGWHLRSYCPVTLADSVPEPDVSIVRGAVRDYLRAHPGAAAVSLAVEVSDVSLAFDRSTKQALYAEARIPTYWILNVIDRVLEVRTGPRGSGDSADYANVQFLGPTDNVALVLDGVALPPLAVSDLLP